ncbi:MAG: DHA2 family efflux MFS transporter permease subunit [Dehalococcoidales bacterium]|nr:DHA2 family efflux MFS transporter permease subunit [Dehalococcoidales bacterium]
MTRLRNNPWAILFVLSMGFFMVLLDTTIVNIAIPSIIESLNASLEQILWVLNAYIMVYAVLLITAGRLGDMYGQRNLFALGMVIFLVASAISGTARDVNHLIAARIAQGVGGALLTPQTLAILTTIFPPQQRGAAFGVWGAVAGVAAVAGPTLGGFIVTNWGWPWIFYVNLPIGVVALTATFLIIPDLRPGRRHGLDLGGIALASAGLFAIVYGLIEGERYQWGTITGFLSIPLVIALGVLLLGVFVLWERRQPEPLMPLSLFGDRNYALMNWVSAVVAFGMLGFFLPLTIYFQSALGLSALEAGLAIAPLSLTAMVVAPIAGHMADRIGGKYILVGGLVVFALGMGLVDWRATPESSRLTFLLPLILAGLGQGCVFAPMTTVAMRKVNPRMAGAASGVLNTTRQLGGVMGSAAVGAVLQTQLTWALQDKAAAYASRLPADIRQRFVDGFASAAQSGFEVGRGQSGGFQLPAGIPPALASQLQQAAHDVFVGGFVAAMQPTLLVPIGVLLIGAISCLAIADEVGRARRPVTVEDRQAAQPSGGQGPMRQLPKESS